MAGLCADCGAVLPRAARYCPACAAEVAAAEAPPSRRVVTALFCDVAGSTTLGERLDAEALRRLLNRYFDVVSGAVERHGGSIEKFIGDAVVAVFGLGGAREDDAMLSAWRHRWDRPAPPPGQARSRSWLFARS